MARKATVKECQTLSARFAGWKSTAARDEWFCVGGLLCVLAPAYRHGQDPLHGDEIVALAKKILCRAMKCEATTKEVEEFLESGGHF